MVNSRNVTSGNPGRVLPEILAARRCGRKGVQIHVQVSTDPIIYELSEPELLRSWGMSAVSVAVFS
jgi:hypothetical protein